MIGFNNFGNYGHLGNQMFQYASLKGIALNNGYDWCIPDKQYFGNHYNLLSHIYQCFDIKCNSQFIDGPTIEEKFYHFDEDLFNNCPDNINLNGYFQTEKYFINIKDEIKRDFSFNENVVGDCKTFVQNISPNGDVISLHVRRGDYLNLQSFHPLPSVEYYNEALSKFDSNIPVLIFSNDVDWCKDNDTFSSDRFLISESNDIAYDLCMMTMCSHHIMANSSFSWWGVWLSESKHVVAPKKWFGSSLEHNKTFDLYCSDWEIL
jgi:hypothetical protein